MTVGIFRDQSPRKNVAGPAGSNPRSDHRSDAHPTEPTRPEQNSKEFMRLASATVTKHLPMTPRGQVNKV